MNKNKKKLFDIFENDPLGLLDIKPKSSPIRNEDDRLKDKFNEIINFYIENNREPDRSNGVKETELYYRLKGIREDQDKIKTLGEYDICKLLNNEIKVESIDDILDNDILDILNSEEEDIFDLKHLPKRTTMPEYVARRKKCKDFEKYEHIFKQCQLDLKSQKRRLRPFRNEQEIEKGYFFVLKGILLFIEDMGERKKIKGKTNARLRCIFENGTESDMLLRSLSAELYKDGRRVTEHEDKILDIFNDVSLEDKETGFIYVLKSESNDEKIKSIDNLYKIGFSKIDVSERIKNAEQEPTYLMAPVSIIQAFKCYNMNPQKLEQLLHNFFGSSCLNIDVFDGKGNRYTPREWFIAPITVIEEAIEYILNGDIVDYRYDPERQIITGK